MSEPEVPNSWKHQPSEDIPILNCDDPVYKKHI